MTRYMEHGNRRRKNNDTPIVASYNSNEFKELYCKFCNRILSKLQDKNGANESSYCSSCSIEVFPSEVESLRSKNKLTTPEGVYNQTSYASTKFTEPDLRKKKVEIKGGLAELPKRGIKITSYTEFKG